MSMIQDYRNNDAIEEKDLKEIRLDYEKRHQKGTYAAFGFSYLILIFLPIYMSTENDWFVIPLILAFAGLITYMVKLDVHKCPICGQTLGRRTFKDKFCPRCGKQYRE